MGTSTHIRLQQLQNNLWSTTNILQHPNPSIDGPNKRTTTFKIIQLLNHLQLTIQTHFNFLKPYTLHNPYTPIEKLLQTHKLYPQFKKQLRTKQIIYLEQLTSSDNTVLLDWQHISPRLQYIPKGRKPLWFTTIESKLVSDQETREINPQQIQLPSTNSLAFTTGHYKKSKPWLITYDPNLREVIIGKARKYNKEDDTISITHWIIEFDRTQTKLYPTPTYSCTQCTGCLLNSNRLQDTCTLNISTNLATKFQGRPAYSDSIKKLNLHANLIDLFYSITLRNPMTIPPLPTITIYNNPILNIFENNQQTQKLQLIAHNNLSCTDLTFYTDGSVSNIMTERCKMGIGWVQIQDETIIHNYSAEIKLWPSSYKAELMAILSAISTCPRCSHITIYTDSQSIISKYNKLKNSPPTSNKQHSYNYWPIWHTLLNLIQTYQLSVNLHKVTAHSNNTFNNIADELAKNQNHLYSLNFHHDNIYNPSYYLQYNKLALEQPTRKSVKNICNAYIIAMWSSQQRMENILPLSSQINWNATWKYLNNNNKRSSLFTNFKLLQEKTFKIKLMLKILSTMLHFHSLYPLIYPNSNCSSCNRHENKVY